MENFVLKPSSKTPYFNLMKTGEFKFGGMSMPEDAATFYFRIMDWLSDYYRQPNSKTEITVQFDYLNSSSSSMIFKIFHHFRRLQETGKSKITCKWYYDIEDLHMKDYAQEIARHADNIEFDVCPLPHAN